jgi:NTE family protein
MSRKQKVSIVIGSGGVKCAAAIGLWQVLEEAGIEVDSVVGCSGGSLYVVAAGMGMEITEMESLSTSLWTQDVMQGYRENLKASKDGTLKFNDRSGLVNDEVLNSNLARIYGESTFDDLKLPTKIVATDLHSGEKVILSSGKLRDAIRASIAIPIIFPPWEVDGRLLIDGGASDPLPVDVAIQDGADIIIAMGFTIGYRAKLRSMAAVQEQINNIYMNQILNSTYAFHNLAHHAEIFPIIPEFESEVSMLDVAKIPMVIQRGREATLEQLEHIKRALEA